MSKPHTFLCIALYFKGVEFMKACKAAGNTVFLLTKSSLANEAWPKEAIDDFFYLESEANTPENIQNIIKGLAYVWRNQPIDRVVALDDFDVEKAAAIREDFRIPGMGQTTARNFRDKLAMRAKAAEHHIPIPPFSSLFNDQEINSYLHTVTGPWVIKPRAEASAIGIKKVHAVEEVWATIESLGDKRHECLIEQYKPGDVYHADALIYEGKVIFCLFSRYLQPPFDVAHGGGVFQTVTLSPDHEDQAALQTLHSQLLQSFGLKYSASHTEFIKSKEDGKFYFLETASRVGGAHISDMVEQATGINLWTEWAHIENAVAKGIPYELPQNDYTPTGLLVSLTKQQYPDFNHFNDPEISWRLHKDYHIGLIVKSPDEQRVRQLLHQYSLTIHQHYLATLPPKDKPAH
jgi:carbamoylphosphate synthase large subunit